MSDSKKTVADDVLDAVEKAKDEFLIARIILEYDIKTGKFSMTGNVRDEVLTVGMLELAKSKMDYEYKMSRIADLKEQAENGIIGGH